MAKNFLGALRAQSEGQGNLSMHPQGDNLYGYGPTTHFLAYFRLVWGATNTPPAPRFRPVLGLAAPAAPFGSFGTFRDLGSPEPQNVHMHVLGILADRPPRRPTFRPRVPLCLHTPKQPFHFKYHLFSCRIRPSPAVSGRFRPYSYVFQSIGAVRCRGSRLNTAPLELKRIKLESGIRKYQLTIPLSKSIKEWSIPL